MLLSPEQYTPMRRAVMTAVMWSLFMATLGLAAWASRYPADPRRIEFREEEPPVQQQRNLRRMLDSQPD